jgi:ankyrin repeat protein
LHKACGFGQNACVKKLLDCGASIDAVDENGNTGLHLASRLGFDLVINFLISRGAKLDIKNSEGKTASEVALDASIAALFKKAKQ